MHANRKVLGTAIAAAMLLGAPGAAHADIVTWTGGGNNFLWGNPMNWDKGVPTADDRAIVNAYVEIVAGGDFVADSLEVTFGDNLYIIGTGSLTLENDNHNCGGGAPSPACPLRDNHLIDGIIHLDDGGTIRFVNEEVHVLGGDGYIFGQPLSPPDQKIVIDADVTLINRLGMGIRGGLTIAGVPFTTYPHARDGTFRNETLVKADGTIQLAPSTRLDDIPGARWEAAGICAGVYAAEIDFYREALLNGDFEAANNNQGSTADACFILYQDVVTFGTFFDTDCGAVDARNGSVFGYQYYDDGGANCGSNPYYINFDYCEDCPP